MTGRRTNSWRRESEWSEQGGKARNMYSSVLDAFRFGGDRLTGDPLCKQDRVRQEPLRTNDLSNNQPNRRRRKDGMTVPRREDSHCGVGTWKCKWGVLTRWEGRNNYTGRRKEGRTEGVNVGAGREGPSVTEVANSHRRREREGGRRGEGGERERSLARMESERKRGKSRI